MVVTDSHKNLETSGLATHSDDQDQTQNTLTKIWQARQLIEDPHGKHKQPRRTVQSTAKSQETANKSPGRTSFGTTPFIPGDPAIRGGQKQHEQHPGSSPAHPIHPASKGAYSPTQSSKSKLLLE